MFYALQGVQLFETIQTQHCRQTFMSRLTEASTKTTTTVIPPPHHPTGFINVNNNLSVTDVTDDK